MNLPVIYIHDGSASYLPEAPSSASFSIHVSMTAHKHATTAYEPAVPRCKTCCHYQSHLPHDLIRCVFLCTAADDEYCSNHIERVKP
jgi:hypothetical protein